MNTPTMRAKLKISSVTQHETFQDLAMHAVAKSEGYPESGLDEDNSFATWTPSATLYIAITNPNLTGKFKVGDTFYVDFTPVTAHTDETKVA